MKIRHELWNDHQYPILIKLSDN